jgi:hypothetical protein
MSDLSTFTSNFFPFFAAFFAFFAAFFAIFPILPGFVICAFPFATSSMSRCTTTCTNLAHVGTAASLSRKAVFTAPAFSSLNAWKSARQLVPCLEPRVVRGTAGAAACASPRHLHMAGLVEVDRPRRGWRQIELTPADKGTAIIDPHRDASIVADTDQRPKRKRTVRRRHCGTVEALTARGEMTTHAVAVDAGHFSVRRHAPGKQCECNDSDFSLAGSPPPHGCTDKHDRSKGAEGASHPLILSRIVFGLCTK